MNTASLADVDVNGISTNEVSGKLVVGARPQRITPNDDSEHSFYNIEDLQFEVLN